MAQRKRINARRACRSWYEAPDGYKCGSRMRSYQSDRGTHEEGPYRVCRCYGLPESLSKEACPYLVRRYILTEGGGCNILYNPDIHHRKSLRLQHYDYGQAGAYFITICCQFRACLFGRIAHGSMDLNDAGRMVWEAWSGLSRRYPHIELDAFVVMPNHVHGFIFLAAEPNPSHSHTVPNGGVPERYALGGIVGAFKSIATVAYIEGVSEHDWPTFPGRLWQRNFYERILCDEGMVDRAREYILNNPAEWTADPNHPDFQPSP